MEITPDIVKWWPQGPYTTAYAWCVLALSSTSLFSRDRGLRLAMFIVMLSWALARTATVAGDAIQLQIFGTVALMSMAFALFSLLGTIIGLLLALKLPLYGMHEAGWIELERMWFGSEMLGYAILIICLGGQINGGYRTVRSFNFRPLRRGPRHSVIYLLETWRRFIQPA